MSCAVKLIDTLMNKILISGKVCTKFNFGGDTIHRNYDAHCHKCPEVYTSSNAFLCKYLYFFFLYDKWPLFYAMHGLKTIMIELNTKL